MNQPQRIRRSVSQWQAIMSQFAQSNVPTATFCAQHRIAYGTFQRWRQKLSAADSAPASSLDWLPIPLADPARPSERPWDIELALPGGVHLRMRAV